MSSNGKKLSSNERMSERQEQQVHEALERAFRHFNEGAGSASSDRRTHDFIFHMTDWYPDLVRLCRLYKQPESHTQREWNDVVASFLYHAVGHAMAAAKLNGTFLDPFVAERALASPSGKPGTRSTRKRVTAK